METFLEQRLKEIEGNYKCGNCTLTKQPILFQHQSFVLSFRKLKYYKQVPNKTLQNETLPGAVQSKIQYYFKKTQSNNAIGSQFVYGILLKALSFISTLTDIFSPHTFITEGMMTYTRITKICLSKE